MFSRSERKVNSMITKRIFCIAVIGGIICLTACGNSQNNSENSSSAEVVSAVGSRTDSLLDSRVTLVMITDSSPLFMTARNTRLQWTASFLNMMKNM
mgnify:CR=1 FL=1